MIQDLTIILLTHRQEFIERALESIFVQKKKSKLNLKLIINCDTKISETPYINKYLRKIEKNFPNHKYKLYFLSTNNYTINFVYFNAIQSVDTEYFYILEDDDELLTDFNFLLNENNNIDYFLGLYKINKKHDSFNEKELIKYIRNIPKNSKDLDFNDLQIWYQLGQVIFKKETIEWFPEKIDTYNDFYLLKNNPGKIKIINKFFFKQGWSKDSFSQNFNNIKKELR